MLPPFNTERLILQERTIRDIESCINMDRDPEVVRFINGPWKNETKHREFVAARIRNEYPKGLGYWTIEHKNKNFLGWIMLIPIDNIGPEIEIGWRLKRDYWGQGYATEAAKPILDHAFHTVGIDRVVADIHFENEDSIRVAQKIGLESEGLQDEGNGPLYRYSLCKKVNSI
ncbi:GNAT family N-acetyltransferase [Pseudalkalibacillus salsuginis]|uniref:GNAT family N-acetyltransferase n=1 Tax=Pseudalkalibacillus salsuginis TaxID=2910972 RepID=UPI001F30E78D|nr:GNAT family N-acetyltransferase [Pseudalkalibacillus salsuginis]MCF6409500.1 GNAT family N-acetyltransferase [Pseudalkalibacillus salsuginis]